MIRPKLALAVLAAVSSLAACRGPHAPEAARRTWLVVAPHPDDEVLTASGVIRAAIEAGERVEVAIVTNGDWDCVVSGWHRQGESVSGLAGLGLPEERVHFLGYPDGGLALLGEAPLKQHRMTPQGVCELGDTTYGARGFGKSEAHAARSGGHARYVREAVVADLAREIALLRPTDITVTHPMDTHPDHAAAYTFVRDALDRLDFAPRVHRAIVHNGDCWPTGDAPHEPCPAPSFETNRPTPALTGQLAGYVARERLPVPAAMLTTDRAKNPKLLAIGAHHSQTHDLPNDYLFAFARSDEAFFPETFERRGSRWERAGKGAHVGHGVLAVGGGRLAVPEDPAYVVDVDAEKREAVCKRRDGAAVTTWRLPHDLWAGGRAEPWEIAIAPRPEDGDVVEVSFRVRGGLVGIAVDSRASR